MFNNPKELETYWKTAWWLESFEYKEDKEVDTEGVITLTNQQFTFSDKPVSFRYKVLKTEKTVADDLTSWSGTDVNTTIETRTNLSIKKEDLILENLELLPDTQVNRFGLRYANYGVVTNVTDNIDTGTEETYDPSMANLMFKTNIDKVKEIVIT